MRLLIAPAASPSSAASGRVIPAALLFNTAQRVRIPLPWRGTGRAQGRSILAVLVGCETPVLWASAPLGQLSGRPGCLGSGVHAPGPQVARQSALLAHLPPAPSPDVFVRLPWITATAACSLLVRHHLLHTGAWQLGWA
jgi:hypothetical protein